MNKIKAIIFSIITIPLVFILSGCIPSVPIVPTVSTTIVQTGYPTNINADSATVNTTLNTSGFVTGALNIKWGISSPNENTQFLQSYITYAGTDSQIYTIPNLNPNTNYVVESYFHQTLGGDVPGNIQIFKTLPLVTGVFTFWGITIVQISWILTLMAIVITWLYFKNNKAIATIITCLILGIGLVFNLLGNWLVGLLALSVGVIIVSFIWRKARGN